VSTGVLVEIIIIGVRVGGTGTGVLVEVGRGVLVGIGVELNVGRTTCVRGVNVGIKVGVLVGVRVAVGVAVGMVEVIVGVSEGVIVGAVEVGKGLRRGPAVSARAVFVLFACCCAFASRGERLNATRYTRRLTPIHRMLINKTCRGVRLSFQLKFTFAVLLSFTWHTDSGDGSGGIFDWMLMTGARWEKNYLIIFSVMRILFY